MDDMDDRTLADYWSSSRSGAWAGRGFRYQDAVTALLAIELWNGNLPALKIVPEGLDDVSLESKAAIYLIQIKSKSEHKNSFLNHEIKKFKDEIDKRAVKIESAGREIRTKVIFLERTPQNENSFSWKEWSPDLLIKGVDGEEFDQSHIFVESNPKKIAMQIIQEKLSVLPAISEIVFQNVCALVGRLASENSGKKYKDRRKITISAMEALLTKITKTIDSSALQEAIVHGICVPVSFEEKLDDPHFYMGVDVEPGHIAAGLAVERSELVSKIHHTLTKKRSLLISGPSGSGKSALQWMYVDESANYIRWFCITSLTQIKDISSILNLIDGLQPSVDAPVGLVMDDAGKYNADLFKAISLELHNKPGIYFLGSIRNEDIPILGDISYISVIPVNLDEKLAESIWIKLRAEGKSSWAYWKEPFKDSEGLLLEYTHILTQGERLGNLIKGQILRRKSEERFDELNIIRVCSAAFILKGDVVVSDLQHLLDIDSDKLALAIDRLLDEHLIRQPVPGIICGLHDLRSEALFLHAHDEVVFRASNSVKFALQCIAHKTLALAIYHAVHEFGEELVIASIADRLDKKSGIKEWITSFTGLGIATLQIILKNWINILKDIELEPAHWSMATMMACANTEITLGDDKRESFVKINNAVRDFRKIETNDLRKTLLEKISISQKFHDISDTEDLIALLSSLGPIPGVGSVPIDDISFGGEVTGSFEQICSLLDYARAVDINLALDMAEMFGGAENILDQYYQNTPWITKPKLVHNKNQQKIVSSDLYFVSDDIMPDIHGSVVKLCDQLCSLVPDAEIVNARAIDIDGNELRFGDFPPIASKSIPRKNLPAKAIQRWNQIFISLVVQHAAANTETEYARCMEELLIRTNKELKGYLDAWCRNKDRKYCNIHADEIESIANKSSQFSLNRASEINVEPDPVKGGVEMNEPVSTLISSVCGNLIPRLYEHATNQTGLAAFTSDMLSQKNKVYVAPFWQYLGNVPMSEIDRIYKNLDYLRAILGECGENQKFIVAVHSKAKKASRGNALRLCAVHAKNMAEKRLQREKISITKTLAESDYSVKLFEISMEKDDGYLWPPVEIVITITLDNLFTYFESLENIINLIKNVKHGNRRVYLVPIIKGYAVWQFAFSYLSSQIFPANDVEAKIKQNVIPSDYEGAVLEEFDKALDALVKLSTILSIRKLGELRGGEVNAFNEAFDVYEEHYKILNDLSEKSSNEKLDDAISLLSELQNSVREQQDSHSGNDFCPNLARSQFRSLQGDVDDVFGYILAVRIGLVEYELFNIF